MFGEHKKGRSGKIGTPLKSQLARPKKDVIGENGIKDICNKMPNINQLENELKELKRERKAQERERALACEIAQEKEKIRKSKPKGFLDKLIEGVTPRM